MDDTKGVIMIPNQRHDQIAFYLHTLMADVANDLLVSLNTLISATEKKTMVYSPPAQGESTIAATTAADTPVSKTFPGPVTTSKAELPPESSSALGGNLSAEVNASLTSVSSSVSALSTSMEGMDNKSSSEDVNCNMDPSSLAPKTPMTDGMRSAKSSTVPSPAVGTPTRKSRSSVSHMFNVSSAVQAVATTNTVTGPFQSLRQDLIAENNAVAALVNTTGGLSGFSDMLKEKKKVPGRIQKLVGDYFLISGAWASAMQA